MMTRRTDPGKRMRGQAVVEMALAIPILVACAFGGLDLSVQAVSARQANQAAQAAASEAAALVDMAETGQTADTVDEEYLADFITENFPLCESDDLAVSYDVSAPVELTYSHKVYASADAEPVPRDSVARRADVTVTVSFTRHYLTPLSGVLSMLGQSDVPDGFACHGNAVAPVDLSGEGW